MAWSANTFAMANKTALGDAGALMSRNRVSLSSCMGVWHQTSRIDGMLWLVLNALGEVRSGPVRLVILVVLVAFAFGHGHGLGLGR